MKISDVKSGEEYIHEHAYGQPDEKVVCIGISDGEVELRYKNGRTTEFNKIECERYLREIPVCATAETEIRHSK